MVRHTPCGCFEIFGMATEQQKRRGQGKRAYDLEWAVQPRWVKWLTWVVGLPAFLVLAMEAFGAPVSDDLALICFCAFVAVVLAQIFGGWRAKKRGEL